LVFDWDGTLMDSVAAIVACMQQAAADLDLPPLAEERIRRTLGLGLKDCMVALGLADEEALWERLAERYRHHWFAGYRERPLLFPGAEQALLRLAAEGYLLAVATGKSRRGLDRDLESTGLAALFHATRTADEARSKPHPQMLLDLMGELGAPPGATLMVGDTTFDLEMAAAAGAAAVAVESGGHAREELLRLAPLACLATVVELPPWLAGGS
jgi:phosphoglycolate phosphatase